MEPLHYCEKCKKPILPCNEILKDNKYYHKKCLNLSSSKDDEALNKEKAKFTHERRLTLNLKNKYSNDYFGKTLMTEVVRPYLQFKYKIKKNKYLELIPQVSLYFHDLDENKAKDFMNNGGMEKMKDELKEILDGDVLIIFDNVTYGSLLTKVFVFYNKMKSFGNKAVKKLKDMFTYQKEETKKIKEVVDVLNSHSFKCIENLKPNDVKFINQDNLENSQSKEVEIKEFLQDQINTNFDAKSSWSNETNFTEANLGEREYNEEEFNILYDNIKSLAENQEMELKEEIKNIQSNEDFNNSLNINLEKAFKESIFEFRIIGLVANNKEEQKTAFEKRKKECPNCQTKILFHATKISFSSKILTTNFKLSKDNYFGLGVYFADQLDYVKFYYNFEETFPYITKLNESFSIVVSEVYYDQTKFKHVYDYTYSAFFDTMPNEEILKQNKSKAIEKNGVHFAEVDSTSSAVINKNKKIMHLDGRTEDLPKERLIGREYCITDREQILPLYGLNLQRVDYCIIWRDSNFDSPIWKEPLRKNKEIIKNMTGYNLYTESNTKDALRLVWRKRFNKIIIITNIGYNLEGKKYVDKVRKILGFNVVALFFADDFSHLNWIKDYPNGLFCMDDYTIKKYVFNFNEDGYNDIKNNVRDIFGVELQAPKNAFEYPLFEQHKDTFDFLGSLPLDEYNDFEGI